MRHIRRTLMYNKIPSLFFDWTTCKCISKDETHKEAWRLVVKCIISI